MSIKNLLRKIYQIIPFKRQFFILLRFFYWPSKSVYRHLFFQGIYKVKVENKNFLFSNYNSEIETSIFWSGIPGDWERNSIKIWIDLVKNSDVIFDIGANAGIYSLISKALNPRTQVYSFEPISRFYDRLVVIIVN